jgi:hypothetical protein
MSAPLEGTVLVDISPGQGEVFERAFLEKVGHPVLVCHGPHPKQVCPLLAGQGCETFESAHGIVFEFDLDRPQHRAILQRYQELAGEDTPIRAVVSEEQAERYRDLLAGVEVWTHPPTAADLDGFASEIEAVDRVNR